MKLSLTWTGKDNHDKTFTSSRYSLRNIGNLTVRSVLTSMINANSKPMNTSDKMNLKEIDKEVLSRLNEVRNNITKNAANSSAKKSEPVKADQSSPNDQEPENNDQSFPNAPEARKNLDEGNDKPQ